MRTSSPADPSPGAEDGLHAYDHLMPDLAAHAASAPGEPDHDARRTRLVREFRPLVRNLARRYSGPNTAEDLEQAGMLALIKAIDRYDPASTTNGPLSYLVPSVRGEMKRYLRDHSWSMRVPRGIKELSVAVNRATEKLTRDLGRAPRPSELAAELSVGVDEVVETLSALQSYATASLDEPEPTTGRPLAEAIGEVDGEFDLVELRDDLRRRVAELPERDRTILLLRFHGQLTQTQIADRVGLSQMHVSRLLARTLRRLRTELDPDVDGGY